MSTPLEPARNDPTAAQAIAAAARSAWRVPVLSSTPPQPIVRPQVTLAAVLDRRGTLSATVHLIDVQLRTATGEDRTALVERKRQIERDLAHLKGVERELREAASVPDGETKALKRTKARDTVITAGNPEIIYRLYLMFHRFSAEDLREQMTQEQRTFLIGVKEALKDAGYETYQAHTGDPLDGFFEETEAA